MTADLATVLRFWAKVDTTGDCWLWIGAGAEGYGRFRDDGRQLLAHRVAYEITYGPIPGGLTIDHLCGVKSCVRPDHLEPCDRGENARRYTRSLLTCHRGHPFDETNTRLSVRNGGIRRNCRECARIHNRASKARRRLRAAGGGS